MSYVCILSYRKTPSLISMCPSLSSFHIILTAIFLMTVYSQSTTNTRYPGCNHTFSCGAITNVTYPFTGGDRPSYCGPLQFQLTCRNDSITELSHDGLTYLVTQVNQKANSLGLSRSDLYNSSCPSRFHNTTLDSTYFNYVIPRDTGTDTGPCFGNYILHYRAPNETFCSDCTRLGGTCGFNSSLVQPVCICGDMPCAFPRRLLGEGSSRHSFWLNQRIFVPFLGALFIVTAILTYCCRNKWASNNLNKGSNRKIETFILNHGSLAPKRYSYREIKKLTKSFTNKLGQGGFGSVYKGTLLDGRVVAVKVLSETSNTTGEEFINEVASISRTSHVNIVNLLGFCYSSKKTALVYEFMPNKSLDKFINKKCSRLGWDKLYGIAVGVAQGLVYLHKGCNNKIIHFDIKPQNVLLDEDFCPKISDFGLAKLCKKKQSIISSIFGLRGTAGYIAPEVFFRNFGGITHKCDVYSYGMMLLEMAGAREIEEAAEIQSSENYFPDTIYEQSILCKTKQLDEVVPEEENEVIIRKMFLIGFWCIQTDPSDRPSMHKVVKMLEGSVESIQIPPKPSLSAPMLAVQQLSSPCTEDSLR